MFLRIIQNSVAVTNNIMIVGCLMSVSSVFLFGFDQEDLEEKKFNFICQVPDNAKMISLFFNNILIYNRLKYGS